MDAGRVSSYTCTLCEADACAYYGSCDTGTYDIGHDTGSYGINSDSRANYIGTDSGTNPSTYNRRTCTSADHSGAYTSTDSGADNGDHSVVSRGCPRL